MVGKLKRVIRWFLPRNITRRIYWWQAKKYIDSLKIKMGPQKKTLLALNHLYRADLHALANANNLYNMVFRYSLCVVANMQAGGTFAPDNLLAIRPGFGLPPKYYNRLLGKHVIHVVKKGTPVSWELIG